MSPRYINNPKYKEITCKKCKTVFTANKHYAGRICFNCEQEKEEKALQKLHNSEKLKLLAPESD